MIVVKVLAFEFENLVHMDSGTYIFNIHIHVKRQHVDDWRDARIEMIPNLQGPLHSIHPSSDQRIGRVPWSVGTGYRADPFRDNGSWGPRLSSSIARCLVKVVGAS